jgi:hypothetical protein
LATEIFAAGDEFDALGAEVIERGSDHGEFDDGVEVGATVGGGHPCVADFKVVVFYGDVVVAGCAEDFSVGGEDLGDVGAGDSRGDEFADVFGGKRFWGEAVEIHGLGIEHQGLVVGVEMVEGEGFDGDAVGGDGDGVGDEVLHEIFWDSDKRAMHGFARTFLNFG